MPKKILFESSIHQFLSAARHLADKERQVSLENYNRWREFISSLSFTYLRSGAVGVSWTKPEAGNGHFDIVKAKLYVRGDNEPQRELQQRTGMVFSHDSIKEMNERFFSEAVIQIAGRAGLKVGKENSQQWRESNSRHHSSQDSTESRVVSEQRFFDHWAENENISAINVRLMNESCTAPEMRFIWQILGDLRGRAILDIGCGLGEASVYFALKGASVTAMDISEGMLKATQDLARLNGVSVTTHKSAAEDLCLSEDQSFDIIYAGNLFHHVDIAATLDRMIPHMKKGAVVVSWDPVAYNPLINIYRLVAKETRTADEHPFGIRDIRIFKERFQSVRIRWFWLTTLLIFVLMVVVQRRNPNKVRLWKKVVEEGEKWSWLYKPLERLDRVLLSVFPFLGPLCWNVVVIASNPTKRYRVG